MSTTTESLVGPTDAPLQSAPSIEQLQKLLDAVTICQRYACPLSAASLLRTLSHVSLLIADQLHPSLPPAQSLSAAASAKVDADAPGRNTLE
ncbi:MAG TPA: hypothetical protein VEH27_06050 [Methylomirabilota bacterium]|nr:hypothetical protein [Methylomirabilota bacterium]